MNRTRWLTAVVASVALLALRIYAAGEIGFGDAEALYACYARHPQPVYLDHPGLIGVIARIAGHRDIPSPLAAHQLTAVLATLAPWIAALAARASGASWNGSVLAALSLLIVPEISIGLFGMTPDLPLILLWYVSLGATAWALRAAAGSTRALVGALVSGFAAGLACNAKVTGGLLVLGLVAAWASPDAKPHRKTLAPWGALAIATMLTALVVGYEIEGGFPMLRHRLIDSQTDAGLSLRNLGAIVGGQLLYVTPPILIGAFVIARDLRRRWRDDAVSRMLATVTLGCFPLLVLACVSRVAEPHWIAPIYLALPLHLARRADTVDLLSSRLMKGAAITGFALIALAHAWVLTSVGPRLLGSRYEPRYDLANDLYAWRPGTRLLHEAINESIEADLPPPVVVGPHWTVCAQLHAALPSSIFVGCHGEIPDDFDTWLPRSTWEKAPQILYVTDDRFELHLDHASHRVIEATWHVDVLRAGRVVRRITVARLRRHAVSMVVPNRLDAAALPTGSDNF